MAGVGGGAGDGSDHTDDARLTMTFLLPPVFFVIFIALALAVFWEASRG